MNWKGYAMKYASLSTRLTLLRSHLSGYLLSFTPAHPFIAKPKVRIFLVSFTMLFFELLCIRWIPSYIRYLSYFNNFILMASFLGIGLGMLSARRKNFWFLPFPLLLLIMVILVALNKFTLLVNSTDVLYYGAGESQSAKAENFLVLPLIFGMVTLCFIPLARMFGQLFTQVKPLTAYTFDIIGSLAGIACFYIIAYFALPPLLWFLVLAVFILLLSSRIVLATTSALLLASVIIVWQLQAGTYWSPYYKIILHPAIPRGYIVDVTNAGGHQSMIPWQYKEPFYRRVYELFPGS